MQHRRNALHLLVVDFPRFLISRSHGYYGSKLKYLGKVKWKERKDVRSRLATAIIPDEMEDVEKTIDVMVDI